MRRHQAGLDYAILRKTGNQTISTGDTNTTVNWETLLAGSGGIGDPANERIEVNSTGLYIVKASLNWDGVSGTGEYFRYLRINKSTNGGSSYSIIRNASQYKSTVSSANMIHTIASIMSLNAGDILRISAAQGSGSSDDIVGPSGYSEFSVWQLPHKLL